MNNLKIPATQTNKEVDKPLRFVTFPVSIRKSTVKARTDINISIFPNTKTTKNMIYDFPKDYKFQEISTGSSNYQNQLIAMQDYLHELIEHLRDFKDNVVPIRGKWQENSGKIANFLNIPAILRFSKAQFFWQTAVEDHNEISNIFSLLTKHYEQVLPTLENLEESESVRQIINLSSQLESKHDYMSKIAQRNDRAAFCEV